MPEPVESPDSVDLLVLGGGIARPLVFGVTAARTSARQVLAS